MYPVILRADALAAGMSPAAIGRMLRRGRWIRLHHGVYVEAGTELSPDLRAAAALRVSGPAVASHQTAARVHGIEVVTFGKDAPTVEHVTRRARGRPRPTLIVHGRRLPRADHMIVRGNPVTTAIRTVRDLLLDADRLTAIWAAEDALRFRYVDAAELGAALEEATGQRAIRTARERFAMIEPRSESPLETGVRLLAHDAGLPALEPQIPVLSGRYRIDLGYRRFRLGIECDGKAHEKVRALYSDRVRANALEGLGWRLIRFTWSDLMSRPEYIVTTIRAAISGMAA
ncbi:MAG TPA: type IV toxin-antitoxin system AbiEi family antitoxin domain-containing protein [Mycobacteriales bacterium]|nr:type IV toxin-antitoxin system AbiEi family antitoxin domain-containing protein [Mycobacteriales bacterium]